MVGWITILIIVGAGVFAYFILHFIMGYLERAKNPRTALIIDIIGVLVLIAILAGGYFYFFIISPTFVEKPYIEKPYMYVANASTKEVVVNEQHIRWLVNEMGGYKLHNDPLSKTPAEFEFFITDFNKTYTVKTTDHNVITWVGGSANPDGRIYGKQETIILLFQSANFKEDLVKFVKEGKLVADTIADQTTLALKGYKGLYDSFK